MISIVHAHSHLENKDLLYQAKRIRNKIFYIRHGWKELNVIEGLEFDEYDNSNAIYIILHDQNRIVYGLVRLLPTLVPYMVEKTFTNAKPRYVPKSLNIYECSRFCIDTKKPPKQVIPYIKNASHELYYAIQKFGLDNDIQSMVTYSFVAIEKLFHKNDWPFVRKSGIDKIGNMRNIVAKIPISEANQDLAYQVARDNIEKSTHAPSLKKIVVPKKQSQIIDQLMTDQYFCHKAA